MEESAKTAPQRLNRLRKNSVDGFWWKPPALAGGSWTLVQRKAVDLKMGFSPGFPMPALKRIMFRGELPGALKRSYPRINAGASTQGPIRVFFRSLSKAARSRLAHRRCQQFGRGRPVACHIVIGAVAHRVQSRPPKRIGNPGRSAFIQAPACLETRSGACTARNSSWRFFAPRREISFATRHEIK